MRVKSIEEARLVKELFDQLCDEQIVVFRYPEHASNNVGIANLPMLEAMVLGDKTALRQAAEAFQKQFNQRLLENQLAERAGFGKTEDERFNNAALWFYEDDATRQRQMWLQMRLERANVNIVRVIYGSQLHGTWCGFIRD